MVGLTVSTCHADLSTDQTQYLLGHQARQSRNRITGLHAGLYVAHVRWVQRLHNARQAADTGKVNGVAEAEQNDRAGCRAGDRFAGTDHVDAIHQHRVR